MEGAEGWKKAEKGKEYKNREKIEIMRSKKEPLKNKKNNRKTNEM